jgi:hypothetical protein
VAVRDRICATNSEPFIFLGRVVDVAGRVRIWTFPFFKGQSREMCPCFLHRKKSPSFINFYRSSTVIAFMVVAMTSTSIAFGSFRCTWKFQRRRGSSLPFTLFVVVCPHPSIRCIFWKLLSRRFAQSYHSFRSLGAFGNSNNFRCKGMLKLLSVF